ncbi:PaaI family thioesterase [Microbaculum marinum]|uniref:Medium/long-chain acyl-CoA thioesterase YigI n=1 Tax=Microbaculum marinum TaxID=1764581 RepID=A0AAW9RAU5_9HYPH
MTQTFTVEEVQKLLDSSPYNRFLGLEVESLDVSTGAIAMRMPIRPELERGGPVSGQFHGGPVASLIDTVGDFAVAIMVGGGVPTINFRVDYLRPSTGASLLGTATVRRVGRSVGVVDIDVTDEQGRLTAVGRGCYGTQVG